MQESLTVIGAPCVQNVSGASYLDGSLDEEPVSMVFCIEYSSSHGKAH